jgi:hypothetical protein
MTTLYALLRNRCGLSLKEAAAFHDVHIHTVTSWSSGRNQAPASAIAELRELYYRMRTAVRYGIKEITERRHQFGLKRIELAIASSDEHARELGLPCVGAHAAMLGMLAGRLTIETVIVPRDEPRTEDTARLDEIKVPGVE